MTVQEATAIVYMLHTTYIGQDRKATEKDLADRVNLFAVVFADYDVELVRQAAFHCIKTCTFMPTPAELLQACKRARMAPAEKPQPERLTSTAASLWTDERLDELCRWIGFGCEEEEEEQGGFLPYET